MVGPDPAARGGIASVISVLLRQPLLARFHLTMLPTWVEGGAARLLWAAIGSLVRAAVVIGRGDVVHIHLASRGSFYRKALIAAVARLRGAHVVVQLHGGGFHSFAADAGLLVRLAVRRVFRGADAVLVLSPVWAQRVEAFSGRNDCVVVPNPVEVPDAIASMEGVPTVVFLGRLSESKGTDDLLAAVRALQSEGMTHVRWVIAGDGDFARYRSIAERLPCPSAVSIPGWLDGEAVHSLLLGAWVFCLPSYNEGKPLSLLEAMGHGLACVATPVGGIPDVIEDRQTGMLVGVGDVETLAAALRTLIESLEECRRLGRNARQVIENGYSAEFVASTLSGIYDSLLDRAEPGQGVAA